jgi:hypothetical protein
MRPNCWNSFNICLFFCLHSCIHNICIIFILLHPFPAFSPLPLVSTCPPGRTCSAPLFFNFAKEIKEMKFLFV